MEISLRDFHLRFLVILRRNYFFFRITKNQKKKMKKVNLPIDSFKNQILETIEKNPVSIIVAETGAGKSTRVPQFLLEATNYEVVVTQPRRVAAKSVAKRVAFEMDCRFGGLVGFRTAVDRNDSIETRCLFATDGLQLVRELTSAKQTVGNGIVLIIDEVHEWNQNIETLVAWVKKAILEGADIKVVLMSATLDYERLSEFFDNAPVIEVPGRCFPVLGSPSTGISQKKSNQMIDEIKRLVSENRNTLVFLPGKKEIAEMQDALKDVKLQAVILPLHGELESHEQDRVFDSYKLPKIILSTNIAQTSVTIPDIDAVIDSGLERRIELVNNVETLTLANISQADCLQRSGRAGRVREGEYVLCNNSEYEYFAKYPTPEILRSLLDQMVLRLAGAGLDATTLPFYHQPEASILKEAKETLIAIEALDALGKITKLGYKINKFPTEVKAARMILEAIERKCLNPVLTIAAILGVQGGSLRRRKRDDDPLDFKTWQSLIDPEKEYQSDLLVELELFWKGKESKQHELAKNGIMPKAYRKASEIRGQLREAVQGLNYWSSAYDQNAKDEEAILKSIASGMVVHLYQHTGGGEYKNGDYRKLTKESILNRLSNYSEWIVGEPVNISFTNRRGHPQTIELVGGATVVKPEWMVEIAPHLVSNKVERLYWSSEQKCVVEDHITIFNGIEITREAKKADWSEDGFKIFVNNIMSRYTFLEVVNELFIKNTEIMSQYDGYWIRSGGIIEKKINSEIIGGLYRKVLEPFKVSDFSHLEKLFEKEVSKDDLRIDLSDLISQEQITSIEENNPLMVVIEDKEFSVKYSQYNGEFFAVVEYSEDSICESKLEALLLPSGRELKINFRGYARTLSECRGILEKARLDEIERVQRNLVDEFKNKIYNLFTIPQHQPFYDNSSWSYITENGKNLQNSFNSLQTEMIEGLTLENFNERIEIIKTRVEEIKNELSIDYEKANALIISTEENFNETLAQVEKSFVEVEVEEIRNYIYKAKTSLQKGEFVEVNDLCVKAQEIVVNLETISETRKIEQEDLIKKNNIPDYVLNAFRGNVESALQFMSNVAKLETSRLDSWELSCGRSRARATCENAWSAMGEDSSFFCGADPNDVKYYVDEYHFGNGESENLENEEDNSSDSNFGNSDLAEALRRAGVVK